MATGGGALLISLGVLAGLIVFALIVWRTLRLAWLDPGRDSAIVVEHPHGPRALGVLLRAGRRADSHLSAQRQYPAVA